MLGSCEVVCADLLEVEWGSGEDLGAGIGDEHSIAQQHLVEEHLDVDHVGRGEQIAVGELLVAEADAVDGCDLGTRPQLAHDFTRPARCNRVAQRGDCASASRCLRSGGAVNSSGSL